MVKGKFLKLDNTINFGVDLNGENNIPQDTLAIHYKGKNKPWNINYIFSKDSRIYQNLHISNFNAYHVTMNRSNILKFIRLDLTIKSKIKIFKIQVLKWV